MGSISVTLRVFFEEPFWIGMIERMENEKLAVCKVTFGAEPKDYEVSQFFLKNYFRLRFSPAVETTVKNAHRNPKRMQREVRKQIKQGRIGTKSQQALNLQREEMKTERKVFSKEQKKAEQLYKFQLKQQKKKEKHRGR